MQVSHAVSPRLSLSDPSSGGVTIAEEIAVAEDEDGVEKAKRARVWSVVNVVVDPDVLKSIEKGNEEAVEEEVEEEDKFSLAETLVEKEEEDNISLVFDCEGLEAGIFFFEGFDVVFSDLIRLLLLSNFRASA